MSKNYKSSNFFSKSIIMILFSLIFYSNNYSQVSDYISNIEIINSKENEPLIFNANIIQPSIVNKVEFVYKSFGQSEFAVQDMNIAGSEISVAIASENISVPYIEYYIRIIFNDGNVETYPQGSPNSASPLKIEIVPLSPKDNEIIILSPQKGEVTSLNELLITISLLRLPNTVQKKETKIFIDDADVTSFVLFVDDLLILRPENMEYSLKPGSHILTIKVYEIDGNLYYTKTFEFKALSSESMHEYTAGLKYGFDIEAEARNERFNKTDTWYNNVTMKFNSDYEGWNFRGRAFITSEEESSEQPQNRYYAELTSSWLNLRVGDDFPNYSSLIMEGKRLRGISGKLKLGFFNLQSSYGQIRRGIEGKLIEQLNTDPLQANVIRIDSLKYGSPFGRVNFGTFNRDLFTATSFAEGSHYKFGLSYLHSKDDNSSITFGGKPQENAVFGSNLNLKFDQSRIQISGQAAVSVFNTDISTGELSDAQIDSLFGNGSFSSISVDDAKRIKSIVSPFLTFNQFMGPLNPEKYSTLVWESVVRLNYFNNSIKGSYIYRGNDYRSFGQTYLRTDIKGYNLMDRLNLVDNKLFISLGYENLEDNLQNTKPSTTVFQTINSAISIYPRNGFPNITIGYSRYDNNNSKPADSLEVNNITDNITGSLSYNFIYGVKHFTRFSITSSVRDDRTLFDSDADIKSAVFNISSVWSNYFSSILNVVYSSSEIRGLTYKYSTVNIGGKFNLVDNKLKFSATIGPSFGDLKRFAIDIYGKYEVIENFNLGFQARYYKIQDQSYTSIFGITAQVNI